MTIGILDPFSGIAGDMTLGALVDCGLDPAWLLALPGRLGLDGVGVRIRDVVRGELACKKVDFDIPPQPHGRHLSEIRSIVARSDAPPDVRARSRGPSASHESSSPRARRTTSWSSSGSTDPASPRACDAPCSRCRPARTRSEDLRI